MHVSNCKLLSIKLFQSFLLISTRFYHPYIAILYGLLIGDGDHYVCATTRQKSIVERALYPHKLSIETRHTGCIESTPAFTSCVMAHLYKYWTVGCASIHIICVVCLWVRLFRWLWVASANTCLPAWRSNNVVELLWWWVM